MNPRRLQRSLRFLTLSCAALGGLYLWNRYEVIVLPGEGCLPLQSIRPGNTLWIDLVPARIGVGDVVFFDLPEGTIALAQVGRIEEGPLRYWLETDNPGCPGYQSEELGWIDEESIHGRLMMSIDL